MHILVHAKVIWVFLLPLLVKEQGLDIRNSLWFNYDIRHYDIRNLSDVLFIIAKGAALVKQGEYLLFKYSNGSLFRQTEYEHYEWLSEPSLARTT